MVPKLGTRPTSDRVREAIFSALEAREAVRGARVLDLYAGSGALGLEAASRGARVVTLVEKSFGAAQMCRRNAEGDQARGTQAGRAHDPGDQAAGAIVPGRDRRRLRPRLPRPAVRARRGRARPEPVGPGAAAGGGGARRGGAGVPGRRSPGGGRASTWSGARTTATPRSGTPTPASPPSLSPRTSN